MTEKACRWDHQPPSEFEGLPHGVGGWTIAYPFFEDVEGANTLGVDKYGRPYSDMKATRDAYQDYYDERMEDIAGLVSDLSTELTITQIESKLSSIHTKIAEIDAAYLSAIQDMHRYMDEEDANLYDDYMDYLDSL